MMLPYAAGKFYNPALVRRIDDAGDGTPIVLHFDATDAVTIDPAVTPGVARLTRQYFRHVWLASEVPQPAPWNPSPPMPQ